LAGFCPRVSQFEGRVIEAGLAAPTLFDEAATLRGAVVEASYARRDPAVLTALRTLGVPFVIDPQALRFVTSAYLEVSALRSLPYAPSSPLNPSDPPAGFVEAALRFQEDAGASAYLVPALPTISASDEWAGTNEAIHRAAADVNGRSVEHRQLVGFAAPGWEALRQPEDVLGPLSDAGITGIYVQPTRLIPTKDSVEKLAHYCRFLLTGRQMGLRVIAGRVGAFGLVLSALGIDAFDSGLGESESFNLSQLNRPPRRERGTRRVGGRDRRVYIAGLKTTLPFRQVESILREDGLRTRFACSLPCCRWAGFEQLTDSQGRRLHYLRTRLDEVDRVAPLPTASMRIEHAHSDLLDARDNATVVKRVFERAGLKAPSFDHLDCWLAVLARVTGTPVAA
jgi:hypothetical protein